MTDWTAFAGFSGVVVLLLLLLARASQSLVSAGPAGPLDGPSVPDERDHLDVPTDRREGRAPPNDETTAGTATGDARSSATASADGSLGTRGDVTVRNEVGSSDVPSGRSAPSSASGDGPTGDARRFGTGELLANVFLTHGLFAALVAGGVVFWEVPPSALGVSAPTLPDLGWGLAAGAALYLANVVGAAAADRLGVEHEETLRELLAPGSPAGWVILLGGVLPVVAVGEELIFRGVLVGALSAGFGLPVWGLAVVSSVAFALGHGAQGTGGIVVTGVLGFALAAVFVVGESLLLVIAAHYVVNALEFVINEGLGVEWAENG